MEARQSSRVKTDAAGSCKSPRGHSWDVNIDDLSPGGCRVDDPSHGLELGKHIQIMIEETGPHTAEVAWRLGDRVGLEFIQPLADDVFEMMASQRWDEARDAVKDRAGTQAPIRFAVRRIM